MFSRNFAEFCILDGDMVHSVYWMVLFYVFMCFYVFTYISVLLLAK